jgi:hypothetical protein
MTADVPTGGGALLTCAGSRSLGRVARKQRRKQGAAAFPGLIIQGGLDAEKPRRTHRSKESPKAGKRARAKDGGSV